MSFPEDRLSKTDVARSECANLQPVKEGRYRHFKGKYYTVVATARSSETCEEMVVYRQEYGERGLWVRPKVMFLEIVEHNGQQIPRFQFVGDDGNALSGESE